MPEVSSVRLTVDGAHEGTDLAARIVLQDAADHNHWMCPVIAATLRPDRRCAIGPPPPNPFGRRCDSSMTRPISFAIAALFASIRVREHAPGRCPRLLYLGIDFCGESASRSEPIRKYCRYLSEATNLLHDGVFANRGMGATSCLDTHDALRRQRLRAREDELVFLCVDVIGDHVDVVVIPKSRQAAWLKAFKHELLAFPSGKYDDQVDSMAQFLDWIGRRPGRAKCERLLNGGRRAGLERPQEGRRPA